MTFRLSAILCFNVANAITKKLTLIQALSLKQHLARSNNGYDEWIITRKIFKSLQISLFQEDEKQQCQCTKELALF